MSADELAELTPKQREFYLEQKKAHEDGLRAKEIETAVKAQVEVVKAEIENESASKIESAITAVKDEYDRKIEKAQAEMQRAKVSQDELSGLKTLQDELLEKFTSEEGQAMLKSLAVEKRISKVIETKAMTKPVGSTAPQFVGIVGPGYDVWQARQTIPVFPTTSDLIKYNQFTVDPDADGFGMVAQGNKKPDLGYIVTPKEAPVRKIAGVLDVVDEFMDDLVGAASYLSYELPQAYFDFETYQVFKGSGQGENLLGLWTQASVQTLPQGTVTTTSNAWDKIAAAISEVRTSKRATSAVYLNPIDYMELLINKDDENGYTYPIIMGNDNILRIGGVPILWSNVFEEGEGLVGDFARGTAIFQRKAMELRTSEHNNDNFEKNVITLRLEGREALPIYYPEAFLKLNLDGNAS